MGCALAVQMAADERGRELLGLEIVGIGRHPHPETMTFMAPLTSGEPTVMDRQARTTLRHVLWTPRHLYPAGAATLQSPSVPPGYKGDDLRGWTRSLPQLAAHGTTRPSNGSSSTVTSRDWPTDDEVVAVLAVGLLRLGADPRDHSVGKGIEVCEQAVSIGLSGIQDHLPRTRVEVAADVVVAGRVPVGAYGNA